MYFNLIFVQLTVLVFLFSLFLKGNNDKTNKYVHHKESNNDDVDDEKNGDLHSVVVHRSYILAIGINGFVQQPGGRKKIFISIKWQRTVKYADSEGRFQKYPTIYYHLSLNTRVLTSITKIEETPHRVIFFFQYNQDNDQLVVLFHFFTYSCPVRLYVFRQIVKGSLFFSCLSMQCIVA